LKKSIFKIITLIVITITVSSCGSHKTESQTTAIINDTVRVNHNNCELYFKEAKAMDSVLMKTTALQKELAERAIHTFTVFATQCKNDSLAPVFLIKSGQVAQSIGNYKQAEYLFKTCSTEFPNFRNRGAVLFLLAQLYDDAHMLNNEAEAKKWYEEIISTYPKTAWERDAKASIQNLGKTDEQLIQEFLKKNK